MNRRATVIGDAYRASLEQHGYRSDPAQLHAIARLDDLRQRLHARARRGRTGQLIQRLGGATPRAAERGIYLWGGVGRGKTYLMDLFHSHVGVPARREHFHRYMKDVHASLARHRDIESPLEPVAAEMAKAHRVLCLDELFVSDIADAMILSGLFAALIGHGMTIVCTSNVPPSDLYRDGLQRARFLPAIALLEKHTEVVGVDGGTDYRLRQLELAPLWFDAADTDANEKLQARYTAIAGDRGRGAHEIEIDGRAIPVRRSSSDVIWFDFDAICAGPRSQSDYIEIARDFHTVFVSGVPVFDGTLENEARRFVALVDEFYDRGVKLALSAHAPAIGLYRGERLAFEFERTRSRLIEMQTHEYLSRPHRP